MYASSFTIRPQMDRSVIGKEAKRLSGTELKESKKRREDLQKLATMHTGKRVYVEINGSEAFADISKKKGTFGYTDRVTINVPSEIPDQVVTSMDDDAWELMYQKMMLYHELGHVLYTDWPSFEDILMGNSAYHGVPMEYRDSFKTWWNFLEDATIESGNFLCDRFNIADDLRIVRENVFRQHTPSKNHTLREAVSTAVLNYKHDTGWIDQLLDENDSEYQFITDEDREIFEDEVYPEIEDRAPDIITEGDAVERNEKVGDLFHAIHPSLETSRTPGDDAFELMGFPPDADEKGDGSEGRDVDTDQGSGADEPEDFEPPDSVNRGADLDVQRDYGDEVDMDMDEEGGIEESLEEWSRVIDTEYDQGTSMELRVPDDPPSRGSFDDATRQEAQQLSQALSKEFEQRLKQEQRTKKQTGKKSGKIDQKRVHKAQQGSTNVMKKHSEPDAKDYSCMILIDRSGSMKSYEKNMTPDAEKAAGALAYALEDVGVDVGIISVLGGHPWLEKDFAEDVDDAKKRIFRDAQGGGTPFSDALALAKARLESEGGNPFVIALTDGKPDNRERYRDILDTCDFPVMGIYLSRDGDFSTDQMNESAYFHALEHYESDKALKGTRSLTKRVMF